MSASLLLVVCLSTSLYLSHSIALPKSDMIDIFKMLTGEIPMPPELQSEGSIVAPADRGGDQPRGATRRNVLSGTAPLRTRVPDSAIISVGPVDSGRDQRQRRPPRTMSAAMSAIMPVTVPTTMSATSTFPPEGGRGNGNGNENVGDDNGNNNGNCQGNCVGNESGNGNGNQNLSNDNGNNNGNCVGNCFFNIIGNGNGNANTKDNQGNNNGNCFGNCFYRFAGNNVGNVDADGQVNGVGNCMGNCFTVPSFALQTDFGDLNKYEMEKETPQCYKEGSFYRPIDGTFCRGVERTYMIGSGADAVVADTRYLCHPGCVFDYKICGCEHWFMVSYKTCSSGIRA